MARMVRFVVIFFFFQAEDGIRDYDVTGVQTCALPIFLRSLCDIWERHGSGLIAFHGQSGDIMFQGCTTENTQKAFDELNKIGFDLGGAGPALRTSMSCVGHARCEQSCFDEIRAHRSVINSLLDEMHRPALPYKFKFKFSGCANDCVNAIHRSDFAVIGTWQIGRAHV